MKLLDRRIPTILGLLILLIGVGVGIYFVGKDTLFAPKLDPQFTPKKVKITNVKNDQFTVSWTTNEASSGFVRYGKTPALSTTVADDREQRSGATVASKTHYVTVSNLTPTTKYYFKLGGESEKNLYDNNGRPYEITTAPAIGAQPPADLANGKVLAASGSPAAGAIVYLTLPDTVPLSALVTNDGSWVITLSSALNTNLTGFTQYDSQTASIDILVQGESQIAKALVTTANDSPVPEITLGQTYDFRTESLAQDQTELNSSESEIPEEAVQLPSQFNTEPLTNLTSETEDSLVELTNPTTDGETIYSLQPEIIGTGPAKKILTITLESPKTYTSTVIVGTDGSWSYSPPEDLEPGEHTITIDYVDDDGEEQSLQRTFIVAAAAGDDDLPAFSATPSAESTSSATPSARTTMPSTESGVPSSGSLTPTLTIFLTGSLFLILGFVLKLNSLKLPSK